MHSMISVKNLTKKFGDFTAVDMVSFEVQKGEILAFLGPNGAGKSTTIKMLTTLLSPSDGTVAVNGYDIITQPFEVRKSFGIAFQDQSLDDDLTAYENLEFHGVVYGVPREVRRQRIEELLRFVDLWDRKDDFVKKFSGGMKRRLEIARALLHHPKIIFLDEPTVGLDPQTRNHIWSYVQKLNREEGVTVFFTTHYMEEAEKVASRVIVVDKGKIVGEGTAESLMKKTKKKSLEDAFISLTGHTIRNEEAGAISDLRMHKRMWGR